MEIIVSENATNGIANIKEIREYAIQQVEPYKGLVVLDENVSDAKNVMAKMRKVIKVANDTRIRIERENKERIALTIDQLKEIVNIYEEAVNTIDKQVKETDQKRKAAKRAELEAYYAGNVGAAKEYINFEDVFDPKWLNATVTLDTAKEQMDDTLSRYKEDVAALDAIEADPLIIGVLKANYKQTKSIANVLQLKAQIEQDVKMRAEREAKRAAEAVNEAELTESKATIVQKEARNEALFTIPTTFAKCESNELIELRFWLKATREQLTGLRQYLKDNEIEYGKID